MKFIKEELSSKGTARYMFALGKGEAIILHELLQKAIMYMPNTRLTSTTEHRMRGMAKIIGASLKEFGQVGDDDYVDAYEKKTTI